MGYQYAPAAAPAVTVQAPASQERGRGGLTVGTLNINDQSDPVSTWHEMSRRATNLAV